MDENFEYQRGFALGWDCAVKAIIDADKFDSDDYKKIVKNVIKYILNYEKISNACFDDLSTIGERLEAELGTDIRVGDWVSFKERNNSPFKVTKIKGQLVYGVADDGFTYAGVNATELERV